MGLAPASTSLKVYCKCKFILLYEKRPKLPKATHRWIPDVLDGGVADKRYHRWGQPVSEAEYLIEYLSEPGGLIVDPCAGAGTVAVAAIRTTRRYIATEIDAGTAAVARARCAEEQAALTG
ncbi:MAG TPA: DNA methyltransferase [Bryobacteraceae bacterium]|nr:DNA methyltransferase [Bryobacteraceae bacterium]